MTPRILLFTGKGGVGKTTAAAGTAALAARDGHKTLVLSTDPAHSLADALAAPADAEPREVADGLFAAQVDVRPRLEHAWRLVQEYLLDVLMGGGLDPLQAEEITVLPGAEEVVALLEVRDQVRSGRFDVVVVDCAPTAETLRLLALPDALDGYLERLLPVDRRLAFALGRAGGVPVPGPRVLEAMARLRGEVGSVRDVLSASGTTVRLVLTPERVVVAEARRTLTTLSLYGYRIDAVIANRVFPEAGADRWRRGWVSAQRVQLAEVDASFAPVPVFRGAYQPAEPQGAPALADFAAGVYDGADPLADTAAEPPLRVTREGRGFELVVALPFAEREAMDLQRRGDDLVVSVGPYRRVLPLPGALRRCVVAGARLRDGQLRVRFEPDPSLWPTP